jgi:aminoglycoside phosphotransferase (APT) family kinase protein
MARDPERLTRELRLYLRGGEAITRVVPLSTGHSNETYLLEGLDRILRTEPSEEGLLPPYDMAFQHRVLSAVGAFAGGPPVPRVFELCTDPSVIGAPFFIMERLSGEAFEYQVPAWLAAASEDVRAYMSSQWIGAVVAVHRMPVESMPGPRMTPAEEASHWRDVARSAEAPRGLLELLDDLTLNPPARSGAPTPVHGDPKHGNCFWQSDGRLVGLFDWEMAHVGEPLTDLGYLASFYDQGMGGLATAGLDLPGWWDRSRMIAAWEEGTGRTVREIHRYEALGMCKIAAIIGLGFHLYRTGRATDPRFAAWGPVVPKYVELIRRRIG